MDEWMDGKIQNSSALIETYLLMHCAVKLKENRDIIWFDLIIWLSISLRRASVWSNNIVVQLITVPGANWIWFREQKRLIEVLRLKQYMVRVTEIWNHKNVWKQCPLDPLFSQPYYPIENWSSANSHCVPLSENKCTKIDLRSLKWAHEAGVYRWDHFIHFWWQFPNMQNWELSTTTCKPNAGVPPAW